ncbi:MAG: LysR family transcriptional regulator [Burkholderiaceae bacterium]|nr:LysR family transcriptional regulator [Burkholderiaceae bacterium]
MNLRSIDLNLLTVFDAIMAEGNQSRAAHRLGMSQPAMSNALARLRAALDDPLFVRTAQGMTPTPRGRALAEPVRQALDLVQTGLERSRRDDDFDYRSSTRPAVVVVDDYGDTVIMPRFMNWLMQTAPGVRVRIRRDPLGAALSKKLSDGSVDLAIRYFRQRDGELQAKMLIEEEFVSMVRQDHPVIGDSLSLAQYLALPHVVFGRLGRQGIRNSIVDRELRRLGLTRHIALQVPGFQSMPIIVQNTDFVCTLPRRMAQAYAHQLRLKTLKTPLDLPSLPLYMVWSKSMDRDPAHQWLRNSIYELCRRL